MTTRLQRFVFRAPALQSRVRRARSTVRCPRYCVEKRWIASPTVSVYTTGISSEQIIRASTLKLQHLVAVVQLLEKRLRPSSVAKLCN